MSRRLPAPWTVRQAGESYQVFDAHGQVLCYLYFEDEETRRSCMGRLTSDEARRLAVNIAKLPDLLAKAGA